MNQPKLYECANDFQRHTVKQVIDDFSRNLQWRSDGTDSLLDVGTGTGDVLMDFLYPLVPGNFRKIVGVDRSTEMVEHCKENYSQVDKVEFGILDIRTDTLPREFIDEFDHVTSFYCLHWVQDQRKPLKNIYQVLKVNGDCLLAFLATNTIFDCYEVLMKDPKWMPYMKDARNFISPLNYCKDPEDEYRRCLSDAGFCDVHVELREKVFDHKDRKAMKDTYKAVNPFLDRLSSCQQEELMDEIVDKAIELNFDEWDGGAYSKYTVKCTLLLAYAKKRE